MDILRGWIVSILVVTVLSFVAQAFMPDKSKKYIKLVMGFITMIVIISPVAKSDEILNKLMVQNFNVTQKRLAGESSAIQFAKQEQIVEVYTQNLQTDIKRRVEKLLPEYTADVMVILTDSEQFTGDIEAVYITLNEHVSSDIAQVVIEDIKITPSNSPEPFQDNPMFEDVKSVIQNLYGVEKVSVR